MIALQSSTEIELMLYTPPDPGRLRFLTLDSNRIHEDDESIGLEKQDVYSVGAGSKGSDKTLERVIHHVSTALTFRWVVLERS